MNTANTIPAEVINYQVEYFDQFGTLPTPVLECTVTGQAYTAFGTNLKKKVEKAGDIRTLLTTFVGRGAVKAIKAEAKAGQRKEAKVSIKKTETLTEATA
jgi:hypothetical protein